MNGKPRRKEVTFEPGIELDDPLPEFGPVNDLCHSDVELERNVRDDLSAINLERGEWLDVAVSAGFLVLKGEVFRSGIKQLAAYMASRHKNVVECMNHISVVPIHIRPISRPKKRSQ